MSGVHLVAVDNQKVFVVTADVAIEVPADETTYKVSDAIYAAVLQQIAEVDGVALDEGTYSIMLTATVTEIPDQGKEEAKPSDDNQLELPLEDNND